MSKLPSQDESRAQHWMSVYATKAPTTVSWFQATPATSLDLVRAAAIAKSCPIVDVGAGASTLVDGLLASGYGDICLVDIAESALDATRHRLGDAAASVDFVVADLIRWTPKRTFGLWHDRAVFHFLTDAREREAYRRVLDAALARDGVAVIGTFDLAGPERCSGLPVRRYSAESLAAEFEGLLRPIESRHELHRTPAGGTQAFVFVRFARAT